MASNRTLSSPLGPPACEEDAKALQFIEGMTRNAKAVQQSVLSEILTRNAQTEYLKPFNLDGATDISEAFKYKVPIVSYEDVLPLIRRIADGDCAPILLAHPISEFNFSSGTSAGELKLIPTTKEQQDRHLFLCSLSRPVMNMYLKGLDKGKGLNFMFARSETKTQGGILARTSLTGLYKSDLFKNRASNLYTSPTEAIYCNDTYQSMYTQMLCGLYAREQVLRVGAAFASGLLLAIKFLQLNWQELTRDIRAGSLNPKVTDASIRQCMDRIMRPDPALADFIEQECKKNNWEGIITRIWPNTKYLEVVITGSMSQYIPTLDYYSGGLPKASLSYASTECYLGINLNPMCNPLQVSYTIMPNMAYFEFLPHDQHDSSGITDHQQLVDLVDVEIDKEYVLVITTYEGLYRYRVGDILRVTGFYNYVPQFQFVRRENVLLNIDGEKTNEAEIQAAMVKASQLLGEFNTSVVDYTSYVDTMTIPGHYVIYWELLIKNSSNSPTSEVLERCCLEIEGSLNSLYRLFRLDNSIGPLEIRVVKNGTFEQLMDLAISRGASVGQYKVPRCVRHRPMVDLLDSRVVSTSFSPSSPQWALDRGL